MNRIIDRICYIAALPLFVLAGCDASYPMEAEVSSFHLVTGGFELLERTMSDAGEIYVIGVYFGDESEGPVFLSQVGLRARNAATLHLYQGRYIVSGDTVQFDGGYVTQGILSEDAQSLEVMLADVTDTRVRLPLVR